MQVEARIELHDADYETKCNVYNAELRVLRNKLQAASEKHAVLSGLADKCHGVFSKLHIVSDSVDHMKDLRALDALDSAYLSSHVSPTARLRTCIRVQRNALLLQMSERLSAFKPFEYLHEILEAEADHGSRSARCNDLAMQEREREQEREHLRAELELAKRGSAWLEAKCRDLRAELESAWRGSDRLDAKCRALRAELESNQHDVRASRDGTLRSLFKSLVDMCYDMHPASLVSMARIAFDHGLTDGTARIDHRTLDSAMAMETLLKALEKRPGFAADVGTHALLLFGTAIKAGYESAGSKEKEHKRAIRSNEFVEDTTPNRDTIKDNMISSFVRAGEDESDVKFLYLHKLKGDMQNGIDAGKLKQLQEQLEKSNGGVTQTRHNLGGFK